MANFGKLTLPIVLLFLQTSNTFAASDQCDMSGKTISLDIQVCLKNHEQKHCLEQLDQYQLQFTNEQLYMNQPDQSGLLFDLDGEPKDIMTDKAHKEFFNILKAKEPSNIYKKYMISSNRNGDVIYLRKNTNTVLFGRWNSATQTDFEINIAATCDECSLKSYKAHTDKIGFSPNIQVFGNSICVIN